MFEFELFTFYRHKYDSSWFVNICAVNADFEYGDSRSLFCLGKKDNIWFLEVFWVRITPKG